jgi:hypothetical protein
MKNKGRVLVYVVLLLALAVAVFVVHQIVGTLP